MKVFHLQERLMIFSKAFYFRRLLCTTASARPARKKYSETLLLPKTKFPQHIPAVKRPQHEQALAANLQFEHLYGLQRLWRQGKEEYILHDGPPYANGDVHIGHAVNKVLKDITNRYKLLRGYQINYVPGWDCHGLPIELVSQKAGVLKNTFSKDPLEIRKKAQEIANSSITKQMESFRRWGVMADWKSPYKTLDKNYIKTQLKLFYQLHKKNLVFRELKPVYWSPSSRTALAEAELEYKSNHESPSVHLRVQMCSSAAQLMSAVGQQPPPECLKFMDNPVNVVIWTTTPWSIPANAAIAYNDNIDYSLVLVHKLYDGHNKFYIVATECLSEFRVMIGADFDQIMKFKGSLLGNFQYKHPWFKDKACPFLHGSHVTTEKGTGLVHTAPAHGQDDYILGLKHNLSTDCYITEDGNFDGRIPSLAGMSALTLGSNQVLKALASQIIRQEKHTHSYPYDWRTKKPVIVKTSMQWFLDTNKIKSSAIAELEKVNIFPPNVQEGMIGKLLQRPYWCISRQRVWGVPIPVLFHKKTGTPLVEKIVIDQLCDLIDYQGNVDAWWEVPVGELIQNDELGSLYEKGQDIFDVWLDSGISWNILGDKTADLYLEGVDQFTGWFQSSLLASVALRGHSPYKNLFVHGFVVDDTGKKMSKSLGNVLDPNVVTDGKAGAVRPYGADTLRWWCATQGCGDSSKIAISNSLLELGEDSVQKLRNTLRFLVSFCTKKTLEDMQINEVSYDELMYVDQYMLALLKKFRLQATEDYENFHYHRVMNKTLHFASNEVSSLYFSWIKDRLYCDSKKSQSRKSCIFVLNEIYLTLTKVLGPVLPYLCEEVHSYYTQEPESLFKSMWFEADSTWDDVPVKEVIEMALDVRTTVNQMLGDHNSKSLWAQICCNEQVFQTLQLLHPTTGSDIDKCTSELCDILQVSGIDLKQSEDKKFTIEPIGVGHSVVGYSVAVGDTPMHQCHRCRKYCCHEGRSLCSRCESVLNRIEQPSDMPKDSPPPPPPGPEIPVIDPVKEEILLRS